MATEILRPINDNGVGWTRSTGAKNYRCVDEASKDESDYVSTSSTGTYDDYDFAAPTTIQPGDTINSVTVFAYAKYVTGDLKLDLGLLDEYVGAVALTTSYALYSATFTGITYSDLGTLYGGFSSGSSGSGTVYVCQCWAEVNFTPAGCPKQMMYRMQVMS